jgi:hypothetical protein
LDDEEQSGHSLEVLGSRTPPGMDKKQRPPERSRGSSSPDEIFRIVLVAALEPASGAPVVFL